MKLSFCVCLNHLFLFTFFWITIIFHSNEENDDYFIANSKTIKNSFSLENWLDILFETFSILLILIKSSHILKGIFWVLSRDPITENWEERGWYRVTKSQRITQIITFIGVILHPITVICHRPNHRVTKKSLDIGGNWDPGISDLYINLNSKIRSRKSARLVFFFFLMLSSEKAATKW